MPTLETWLDPEIIQTEWLRPLTAQELDACFKNLRSMLDSATHHVSILFDLRETRAIPAQAPILAYRSGFLKSPKLGKVVVVSSDVAVSYTHLLIF